MNLAIIKTKLEDFHKNKADVFIRKFSDIAGNQFSGEFNVSGFHKQILELPNKPRSIYGIDRCLRLQDIPGNLHSFLFHMTIYAKSVDLQGCYIDPFKDDRFYELQKETISQFLELLKLLKINFKELEVTYLDGFSFGNMPEGRDRLLKRKHKFPPDLISKNVLKDKVKLFAVKSIANIDINATEGSLVGPRLEIAYNGIEIATIVFDCFKIEQSTLRPINYVAGYAIGLERLIASIDSQGFLESIDRYSRALNLLAQNTMAARSSLFKKEVMGIIYATEAIPIIPSKLSPKQKERVRKLKRDLRNEMANLGIDEKMLNLITKFFKEWKYL